ncbi:MAG: YqeG family HAD IIIA-type phosphatase [Clostridiales bacterium]|nr:YqeG family HAD IIIA-type phosphatase [Clostridiales bacterium]
MSLPIPDIMLGSIYELKPQTLSDRGIKLLFMDLDNTLAPFCENSASVPLRNWVDSLKKAGIEPFILSNNRGKKPQDFASDLGLECISRAQKPRTAKLLQVLKKKDIAPEDAAIIGDQIYTDVLCGKRAGVIAIAVRPISMVNPLHLIRYGLEVPFRLAYKVKSK